MKLLAVETATSWQSVALLDDDRVLARHDQDAPGGHAMLLLPAIDRILKEAGLRLSGIDGLICSIGPGSFTGIRVGLSTCLGMRTATGLPLVLVPTLEAMASNVREHRLPICPVLTSRKGEVYWAVFNWTDEHVLERVLPEHVGSPEALAKSLSRKTLLVGDGWPAVESDIRAGLAPSVTIFEGSATARKASAVAVGVIGRQKLLRGEVAGSAIAPLYVQRPEAELRYEQSGGTSPVARRQERVTRKMAERLEKGASTRQKGRKQHG
jgi:tRNA threonylcarbamoyladenosine biosynthesis protein TsaB